MAQSKRLWCTIRVSCCLFSVVLLITITMVLVNEFVTEPESPPTSTTATPTESPATQTPTTGLPTTTTTQSFTTDGSLPPAPTNTRSPTTGSPTGSFTLPPAPTNTRSPIPTGSLLPTPELRPPTTPTPPTTRTTAEPTRPLQSSTSQAPTSTPSLTEEPTQLPTAITVTTTDTPTAITTTEFPPEKGDSMQGSRIEIWLYMLITISLTLFALTFGMFSYYKYDHMKNRKQIKNPMVIITGIGTYDTNPSNAQFKGHVNDLDFINIDIRNSLALFSNNLNFTVYPSYDTNAIKVRWTKQEIIEFLQRKSQELSNNIGKNNNFDGLIVIISGHGISGHIITSDYNLLAKDDIHRIFSRSHDNDRAINRNIPRLFIFDSCEGQYDKECVDRSSIYDETMEKLQNKDGGSVALPELDPRNVWAYNEDHPDYNLILINATSKDFISFGNIRKGSLFLSKLVNKMNANNRKCHLKNPLCLQDMFDTIQDELHKEGKQLPVKEMYNNGKLKKLIFVPYNNICCNCCQKGIKQEDSTEATELVTLKQS